MKIEDNSVYINYFSEALFQFIEEEPYCNQDRLYKRYIRDLFDIIDDYERGERDSAITKIKNLWNDLDI